MWLAVSMTAPAELSSLAAKAMTGVGTSRSDSRVLMPRAERMATTVSANSRARKRVS
ncbi:hypothetical protein D3C86_2005850 [compost metagenome]